MEKWSLTRGLDDSDLTGENVVLWKSGCLGEMVAHGGSTVLCCTLYLHSGETPKTGHAMHTI